MVRPAFEAIGRKTVWLGEAGQGSKMKLAVDAGHGREDVSATRLALAGRE